MKYIISVTPFDHYLICQLNNGLTYKYEMNFVFTKTGEMLTPLMDVLFFKKVFIESGALTWPNGYAIHANTVFKDGVVVANQKTS